MSAEADQQVKLVSSDNVEIVTGTLCAITFLIT